MNKDQGIELAIMLLSLAIYIGYHLWLFFLRPWLQRRFRRRSRHAAVFFASRCVTLHTCVNSGRTCPHNGTRNPTPWL